MTYQVLPIEAFDGEYKVLSDGKTIWRACKVVGIDYAGRWDTGDFIIIVEDDDGLLYAGSAQSVRCPEHKPLRHIGK